MTAARSLTHGQSRTSEYDIWIDMRNRCSDPKHKLYPLHGGRGAKVCERWQNGFAAFLSDVGPQPGAGCSLKRIDKGGNYEPGNVRWVERSGRGRS